MPAARLLIIDDDSEFCEEFKSLLDTSGYETFVLNDSIRSYEMVKSVSPDVILLDIKMEGMDGFEVAQQLKQFPETSSIPIIGITGHFRSPEELTLMRMYGIDGRLNKPILLHDVSAVLAGIAKKTQEA